MRLKKIRLAGFKSFVEPTSLLFPGQMTAIVGPNGCGKSNVIDAVRWVLGESSAKNLRGDAMTDVIFNGSSARKPVGQCSVELIFDNQSARIGGEYANYNELSVKRLVTREGQSTYFINSSRCRRKDVTDLFLGTGLGPRSYAIIEQGTISKLIESKPQELRIFLEEAAGVSRYKERRRETETRIRHTQDNLERLNDVRTELGTQLEKLHQQARTAQKFKELKATERRLKSELNALRWSQFDTTASKLRQHQHQGEADLEGLQSQLQRSETEQSQYKLQTDELKAQLDVLQREQFSVRTEITRVEQADLHRQQRLQQVEREFSENEERSERISAEHAQLLNQRDSAKANVERLLPEQALTEERLAYSKAEEQAGEDAVQDFNKLTYKTEQAFLEARHRNEQLQRQLTHAQENEQRTKSRIQQIQDDLKKIDNDAGLARIKALRAQYEVLCTQHAEYERELRCSETVLTSSKEQAQVASDTLTKHENSLQLLHSKSAALETLTKARRPATSQAQVTALWEHIKIASQWQIAAQAVLMYMHNPLWHKVDKAPAAQDYDHFQTQHRIIFNNDFADSAKKGTLAEKLIPGSKIPHFFNQVIVAQDTAQALSKIDTLSASAVVVSQSGLLLTQSWFFQYGEDDNQGALELAHQLSEISKQIDDEKTLTSQARAHYNKVQNTTHLAVKNAESTQHQVQHLALEKKQCQHELTLAEQNQRQQRVQTENLNDELTTLTELLKREQFTICETQKQLLEARANQTYHDTQRNQQVSELEKITLQYRSLRDAVKQCQQQLHTQQLTLQQEQQNQQQYDKQIQRLTERLDEYALRRKQLKQEKDQLEGTSQPQSASLQSLLEKDTMFEARMRAINEALGTTQELLHNADKAHAVLKKQVAEQKGKVETLTIDIESARIHAQAIVEHAGVTADNLRDIVSSMPEQANEKSWQRAVDKNTMALDELGAVNLAAVEEYETQAQRQAHLNEQYYDLTEALETLNSAIRKIDKETRQRFTETFNQVNADLQALFPKVFGGGAAYLELTQSDVLEAGVTIMAQPPGKKNSTIHLLSGGEKALTALSLVFAIFRLNPAPFCLLDEVDAPLDDANVVRFCNLVSQMSDSVQFIYITHNKIAMEMATHLTGVTMAEPGVSRMVAVDVDDAMAFVEA
ncbi:chromosome segregation protein SMC [Alteromonas lipotrueiana]|uniref:chromosome segregation protein SMC n=1 Tax=Alteromonas lipotrueiana TaxID=2803815 RepID=UPI001C479282|nr:chromosome segregation protein SMC [Alteromonas lipotrueiana]